MNYLQVRSLVREEFNRRIEERFPYRECPKCERYANMVKVFTEEGEEEVVKYRCLNCLTLFSERLEEVGKDEGG